jgi:hypothetical protein
MTAIYIAWPVSAALLIGLAALLGRYTKPRQLLGILIDTRGRYSLTHLQLVTWSIVILSIISGIAAGRIIEGIPDPLGFTISSEVLGLLGISAGSAVTASAVKASKDTMRAAFVAASGEEDAPRLSQIFMLEEGEFADKAIDITKYQNFIITAVLVVAYVALTISALEGDTIKTSALPGFSSNFLVLIGISQAAYVAGKLPNQTGTPAGLTVANRAEVGGLAATFPPRNKPKWANKPAPGPAQNTPQV